jgi:hypothetical protein
MALSIRCLLRRERKEGSRAGTSNSKKVVFLRHREFGVQGSVYRRRDLLILIYNLCVNCWNAKTSVRCHMSHARGQ